MSFRRSPDHAATHHYPAGMPDSEYQAVKLMARILGRDAAKQYMATGCVYVAGQVSRQTYQVHVSGAARLTRNWRWRRAGSYCVAATRYELPPADRVLSVAVMIRAAEKKFLRIAVPN